MEAYIPLARWFFANGQPTVNYQRLPRALATPD